jgi:hypothetical protein
MWKMCSSCARAALGCLIVRCAVTIGVILAVLPSVILIEATDNARTAYASPLAVSEGELSKRASRALQDDSHAVSLQLTNSKLCAQSARRGLCIAAEYADLCPDECRAPKLASSVSSATDESVKLCNEIARRGQCGGLYDNLCPNACAGSDNTTASSSSTAGSHWHCPVLVRLDGGCAHDLSLDDPAIDAGTRVGDVCPAECSGRGGCAAAALDVSFLGIADDSSGPTGTQWSSGVTLAWTVEG